MKKAFLLLFVISCGQNIHIEEELSRLSPLQEMKCREECPTDTSILKGMRSYQDFLSFENFGYRGVGRCRGHSIVNQKVTELANFNPKPHSSCGSDYSSHSCELILKDQVKKIMSFKVQDIYGFKNVYEFSSHPYVKSLLKSYVRGTSHSYRASRVLSNPQSEDYNKRLIKEVRLRINNNQRPYIAISSAETGDHSLVAYKIKGSYLCVHDPNIIFHGKKDQCFNYLYISDDKVIYHRKDRAEVSLYSAHLFTDENKRVKEYIQARSSYCLNSKKVMGVSCSGLKPRPF